MMSNLRNKAAVASAVAGTAVVGLASAAGAESLIPTTGAADISASYTDTVADAWPILVVGIGVGILIKVVRRFT